MFNKELELPLIGKRTYVHSTTFLKTILSESDNSNHITIRFKKISETTRYLLLINNFSIQTDDDDCSGTLTLKNNDLLNFSFKPLVTDNEAIIEESSTNTSVINNHNDLVDYIVTDSKSLCDGLYDSTVSMLYMAKIEINNLCNLMYPITLQSEIKFTSSRFVVIYKSNNIIVAKLLGLLKNV